MTIDTLTLTDFLLARIAEDEGRARAAIDDDTGHDEGFANQYDELIRPPSGIGVAKGGFGEAAARMIATYAVPRRTLAECEAKRRIVELHGVNEYRVDPCDAHDANLETIPCETLRALAAVYAGHPDYRSEWA